MIVADNNLVVYLFVESPYSDEAREVLRRDREEVLRLAVHHGLSAYDATYAALADHLGVQHVTYDRQVLRAGLGAHPRDFLR